MRVFRIVVLLIHFFVVLLLVGTLFNSYIPPRIFPWLNLLSLAFPTLILIHVFFTIFWLLLKKKRVIFFALTFLLFIIPIRRWINFSGKNNEQANLKILTFNVKGGKFGKKEIENYIKNSDFDIVLLQETGPEDYVIPYGFQKGIKYQHTIVLSKPKMRNQKVIIDRNENVNCNANYTDIEINGKIIRFFNIYLQPFQIEKKMVNVKSDQVDFEQATDNAIKKLIPTFKDHQNQVDIIREEIKKSPYPVIVAGDFNAVPNSYEYYQVSKNTKDAFVKVGNGSGTSFHDFKVPLRIDYVFASKELKPVSYNIDRSVHISDHFPVIVEYKID